MFLSAKWKNLLLLFQYKIKMKACELFLDELRLFLEREN